MAAARRDITIEQGAQFYLRLLATNSEDDSIFDLTGYTAAAQVRASPASRFVLAEMVTSINVSTGEIVVSIPEDTTAGIRDGTYHWDLFLRGDDVADLRWLYGTATVVAALTHYPGIVVPAQGEILTITGDDGTATGLTITVSGTTSSKTLTLGGTLNWSHVGVDALPNDASLFLDGLGQWVAPPSAAASNWGTIAGTLASQTDLQAALDAKQSLTGTLGLAGFGSVTGTLVVANGGSGVATHTAYAPLFGGTTSTGAVQSGTVGTSGQILTSNGAGVLPTFQAAPSTAINSGKAVYVDSVNGSDGTGTAHRVDLPFLTLAAAKTAATIGDTVIVGPGTYNERNLLKTGVNWHFIAGAKIAYTTGAAGGIWDDSSTGANGAATCRITGFGEFTNVSASATNATQVFKLTNTSSVITADFYRAYAENTSGGVATTINALDGTFNGNAQYIEQLGGSAGAALFWGNGPCHVTAKEINVLNGSANSAAYNIWSGGSGTAYGQLYVNVQSIDCRQTGDSARPFYINGDVASRHWIYAHQVIGNGTDINLAVSARKGFTYIYAQKIVGAIGTGGGSATNLFVNVQKLAAVSGSTGPLISLGDPSAYSNWTIGQIDDTNVAAGQPIVSVTNGVHQLNEMDMKRTTTGDGVAVSGGSLILKGTNISGISSGYDLNQSGGTLTVLSCSYNSANTNGTITQGELLVSGAAQKSANLSDLASASTARTNLALGTAATQNTGTSGATVPLLNAANTWASGQVFVAPVLGTPASGALTNCTFPTLNQNTSGSAASLTTGRTIGMTGDVVWTSASFNGTGNVTGTSTIGTGVVTDDKAALLVKPAVALVAASNLTLSGEQTIDGTLTSASLVLATAQTSGSQNGPWLSAAGAWTRPTWYTTGSTTQAPQFLTTFVRLGTTYQGSTWRMTTASVTVDTTATTWVQTPTNLNSVVGTLSGSSVSGGTFGAVNGSAITALSSANITASTSNALGIGTIELGHASDTTLSRLSAGSLGVEGTAVLLNGSALGTPSSGTVTNLTGTATININGTVGAGTPNTGAFTTLVAGSTTSLLLGTAGSAVGNIGFRNATSGTATLAPPTGALGTYTVTLPNAASTLPIFGQQITVSGPSVARTWTAPDASFTIARTDAANTFTGVQSMTSPSITTGINDANGNSLLAFTATTSAVNGLTLVNAAASGEVFLTETGSDAQSTRTFTIGTGTSGSSGARLRMTDGQFEMGRADRAFAVKVKVDGTTQGMVVAPAGFADNTQALSGAGAVDIVNGTTAFTSTGSGQALTLANGNQNGQIKYIVHVVDGGSGVLTPTTKTGYTSLTFTNVGDTATLKYLTTYGWVILAVNGTTITP